MKKAVRYPINKQRKRLYLSGSILLLILVSGLVYFWYVMRTENSETLTYDGKTYYATAYIMPNLSGDGKDTKIFGGATYVGDYKNKELDLKTKSKLWKINSLPQEKLLVEMTPYSDGASMMTWCSEKINTVADAFDFLRPTYLTYATYDNQFLMHQADKDKQQKILHELRTLISKKPDFTRSGSIKGMSINELYLNESADQSLVLQASVLQVKNGKRYLYFSGSMGRIGYWQVPDSLLARLR